MSLSRAELAAMDRDELIDEVTGLDRRLTDLQAFVYEELKPRLEALEAENEALRERVAAAESTVESVQSIGSEATSKEEKIAQVVAYADNQRAPDQNRLTVLPKTIKGATGVSRRYAYDLAADMIESYGWALDPRDQPRHVEQDQRQRGVIVDFERLHSADGVVNKFTTGDRQNGGAE